MSEMNIEKRFRFTDVKKPEIRLKEFWDTINERANPPAMLGRIV